MSCGLGPHACCIGSTMWCTVVWATWWLWCCMVGVNLMLCSRWVVWLGCRLDYSPCCMFDYTDDQWDLYGRPCGHMKSRSYVYMTCDDQCCVLLTCCCIHDLLPTCDVHLTCDVSMLVFTICDVSTLVYTTCYWPYLHFVISMLLS